MDSCYLWKILYVNDPWDDILVNAKLIIRKGRLIIIAMTDIQEGDELYII